MTEGYKATPELLEFIHEGLKQEYFCFDDTNIDSMKPLFIETIKKNSTGQWNSWNPYSLEGSEDNIVTDDYTICKFNTADNKIRLEKHLADEFARQKLKQYNWLVDDKPVDIEYKINRNGFRCNNFTDDPGIIFLGCSFTYGTGMPLEDIWPSLVASYFNLQPWNLGTPGMSLTMGTFYLTQWYKDIPNPKAIVILEPPPNRVELYQLRDGYCQVDILQCLLDNYQQNVLVSRLYNTLPFTTAINYRLNIQAVKLLAQQWNIPIVSGTLFGSSMDISHDDPGFARDLMHFGKNFHVAVAEYIIDKLKSQGL